MLLFDEDIVFKVALELYLNIDAFLLDPSLSVMEKF
jgi:hypothetical protein